jgi:AcrR family transcriptional regulator
VSNLPEPFDTCQDQSVAVAPQPSKTRARILEAAWDLVRARGTRVTVAEIARAAGVSRQLVYFHFESRAGLLVAMTRRQDVRSGFAAQVAAALERPGAEGLEMLLRAWHAYVPEILPVARELEAAVTTGDEGAAAWRDRMGDLHDALRTAVEHAEAGGRLAEGWTVAAATDWVWARSQPGAYQHLVAERGWRPEDYVERAVASILSDVIAPV